MPSQALAVAAAPAAAPAAAATAVPSLSKPATTAPSNVKATNRTGRVSPPLDSPELVSEPRSERPGPFAAAVLFSVDRHHLVETEAARCSAATPLSDSTTRATAEPRPWR